MEVQQLYAAVKKTGVVRSLMGGPAESQRAVPLPTPSPATQAATSGMEVKKKQGWQEVGGGGGVFSDTDTTTVKHYLRRVVGTGLGACTGRLGRLLMVSELEDFPDSSPYFGPQ